MNDRDINIILFDFLKLTDKYNYYKYCKINNYIEEEILFQKYFDSLNSLSTNEWSKIIIEEKNNLDEELLLRYNKKIDWYLVCIYVKLSETFIIKNKKILSWRSVLLHQDITDNLIEIFKYELDWNILSSGRILEQELIIKYEDKLNWEYLSIHDPSDEFIMKYNHKINWENIHFNDYKRYDKYKNLINWNRISYSDKITKDFLERYYKHMNFNLINWETVVEYGDITKEYLEYFFNDKDEYNIDYLNNIPINLDSLGIVRRPF